MRPPFLIYDWRLPIYDWRMTWLEISEKASALAVMLTAAWRCSLPERNQEIAATDESECDAWCAGLSQLSDDPDVVPEHIRPLLLVRLLTAATGAKLLAMSGEPMPAAETAAIFQYLLIGYWKARGKKTWLEEGTSFSA